MNYVAHIAPDPVNEDYSAAGEMASSLDSFVSEPTIEETPFSAKDYLHPLWEFPEENVVASSSASSSSASTTPTVRRWTNAAPYAWLVLVTFMSVLAGFWWGTMVPRSRPIAAAVETPQPLAHAPVTEASRDTSNVSPSQLTPSIQVRPSLRPPVATIRPAIVLALPSPALEPRRTADREASTAPSASGDQPARSTLPAIRTRQLAEPTPTGPVAVMNLPAPPPAAVLEAPAASTMPPAAAPPPRTAANVARPEPAALPAVVPRTEQSEIQRTLAQYRAAYDLLDAQAAQAVWPSVDVRALSRAFDTLASQQLAFETCELQIAGESATAECRGSATYAPKIGNREPRLEPRQWTFRLRKEGEGWKIQSAQTRR